MKQTTTINPTWCPGCGNFGILGSIKQSLNKLGLKPHQFVFVYDVGCSGNMADFVYSYGFHGLHGRALPVAAGIKLANHQLPVMTVIGDGGCYGEGLNHFITLARGNHDIVVLSHNNYLYSLTTGQMSPTSKKGTKTPSTPEGSLEETFNPLANAIINHATFVARGFAGNIPHLTNLLQQALNHKGFALLDVLQPCVTYNKDLTYDWYRKNIYDINQPGHDPKDKKKALELAYQADKLPIGIFFQEEKPTYHQQVSNFSDTPLAQQDISNIDLSSLL